MSSVPEPFQPHLTPGKTWRARWNLGHTDAYISRHLGCGVLADGRGWLADTAERNGWIYPDEQAARDECDRRLSEGDWRDAALPGSMCPNGCGPLPVDGGGHRYCDACGYWR